MDVTPTINKVQFDSWFRSFEISVIQMKVMWRPSIFLITRVYVMFHNMLITIQFIYSHLPSHMRHNVWHGMHDGTFVFPNNSCPVPTKVTFLALAIRNVISLSILSEFLIRNSSIISRVESQKHYWLMMNFKFQIITKSPTNYKTFC